ncbi:apyrase [Fragilariopsis cylindrus CCMP1102]|uniref:Apyrase n=1 Tax=Fragilariopsis cylindrus CCMP1102 TaxID=635003 RepID=A0A1E7FX97_9STRA|nr:apyrase [Fragilariopsis cylindrus CCMP1102]|eukprot:OEU22433.1 apyrase [Fragilariopsis cylindrus CCMP1102]
MSSDSLHDSGLGPGGSSLRGRLSSKIGSTFSGVLHGGYFSVDGSKTNIDNQFRFAAVTDLDQLSRMKEESKMTYRSLLMPGTITRNKDTNKYTMVMETADTRTLKTKHNEAGRGAEFSELTIFDGRLLTFDDRTGEVFEIMNTKDGKDSFVAPRYIITEGEGDTDKGMKWEWSTTKDGFLYMGSMGKEYTNPDGSVANVNNLWITVMDTHGDFRRINWTDQYNFVRNALGCPSPGYVIHEAINWSPHMRKWVFMPRRISSDAYNDVLDEKKGSNKLVIVDESFTKFEVVEVNMASKDGLHGFSSFAFVPGTKDRHAIALRTVEEDCAGDDLDVCKQRSYIVIFDVLTGEVLMDEVKIEENMKFEGVEFVNMYTKPPALSSS